MTKRQLKRKLQKSLIGENGLTSNVDLTGGGTKSSGVNAALMNSLGQPAFVSQFDINMSVFYYTVVIEADQGSVNGVAFQSATAVTNVLPENLDDNLKNQVPAFVFGNSDFAGGFKNNKNLLPLQNWIYARQFIVEEDSAIVSLPSFYSGTDKSATSFISPSVEQGRAETGDLIIPLYYVLSSDAQSTNVALAEVVINCKQVAYGTLLSSISSDRFTINNIRYKVPNLDKTAQFEKQIQLVTQSLFGKLATDKVSPAAFQDPRQFQDGIIDIPIRKGIDKQSSLSTYLNYDVEEILWTIYVEVQDKVEQPIV